MSYRYVSDVLRGCSGVDPSAKLILVVYAEHAGAESGGVAWPSVATVARMTCLSERQVQQRLRELTVAGWIHPEGRTRGGRGNATAYRLNVTRMRAAQQQNGEAHRTRTDGGKGEAHSTVSASERVKPSAVKGEAQRPERVKPASPEPEVNHKEPMTAASNRTVTEPTTGTGRSIDKSLTPEPARNGLDIDPYRTPEAKEAAQRFFDRAKRSSGKREAA